MPIYFQDKKTKFGEMRFASFEGEICVLDWRYRRMRQSLDNKISIAVDSKFEESKDPIGLIDEAFKQVQAFMSGEIEKFDLPKRLIGTDFQIQVWNGLMNIPYGKTCSYADLAYEIGNPNAIRAVAKANGDNTLALIVPCHRVIGSDGKLTGYAGGLAVKKRLLTLESSPGFNQPELF